MKIRFDRNGCGMPGWVLRIIADRGAGYTGGCTTYLAYRSGSRRWAVRYRGARPAWIEVGITRNANAVPYAAR